MKTIVRTSLLLAVAAVLVLAGSGAASAAPLHRHGGYDRLDRLAVQLESESRTLYRELRRTRIYDPNLRLALNEVAQIQRQAHHIHDIIHSGAGLDHLHHDVMALQDLVHHVEEHLAHVRHYRRHVERLDRLTHQMDDAIHDLDHHHAGSGPVVGPRPGGRPRVTFGGNGFSFSIGR